MPWKNRNKPKDLAERGGSPSGGPIADDPRLLAHILHSVPQVIWSSDREGKIDFISRQWTTFYDGDPEKLLGDSWLSVLHPDDVEGAMERWAEAIERREPYESEFRVRLPDGRYRWTLSAAKPEIGPDGEIVRWFGTCTDIHDRLAAQEAIACEQRLYRSMLEASADWIQVIATDGTLELVNRPGGALMEAPDVDALHGRPWWELWPEESQPIVRDAIGQAASGETARFSAWCPTVSGEVRWWDVHLTPIRDDEGNVERLLSISRDCTIERERSNQLLWASEHDALTSLPNRRAFQTRLQAAVLRSMQSGQKLGLLLIDLDHFKHVNDTMGHAAGDALLMEFAGRLRARLRPSDFVGRIGGDEFAIIVESVRSPTDLLTVGDDAIGALKTPLMLDRHSIRAGASVGGAIFPDDASSANELFNVADTALYALKSEGRGGTILFHTHMRIDAQRVASQLRLARTVVNEGSIVPFYQPKVDLQNGALKGFEALLRWRHSSRGLQLPDSIEEAFNDYELASNIGEVMHARVLSDVRRWLDRGQKFGCVSINAAPVEFLRDDYAERLLERVRSHRVPPSVLEVEVTEHVLMEPGTRYVRRALAALKDAGVTIALDDFGTGYSSLSHLRDFPVDVVKIDRSFVRTMGSDPEIASIVNAVVNLAKSLNIRSVAEGIETEEQVQLLRALGCDLGQGYLIGKAVPAETALRGEFTFAAA